MKLSPTEIALRAEAASRRAAERFAYRIAAVGEAKREHRLAATWHLRRAAMHGSRDNLIYAFGAGEECLGAFDVDPIALLGFKAAGAITYGWLIDAADQLPAGSYIDHVRIALGDAERLLWCIELGAYHRFRWKHEVYQREVIVWKGRPEACDPTSPWRRRGSTVKQRYLLFLIVNCLRAAGYLVEPPPADARRGELHDWLDRHGGHPLFWNPPEPPPPHFLET